MSMIKKFLDALGPNDVVRALQKAKEIIPSNHPTVMWHGSGSGDLRGGVSGLHLGSHEAAKQALESRIGVPADGEWYGVQKYGETPLAGKKRLFELDPRGFLQTGYNAGYPMPVPDENYFAASRGFPNVSKETPMDPNWTPSILPYRITGEMKNTPQDPLSDMRANATMKGLLTRGQARRGLYYTNEGEDVGSISATVPGPQHVEPVDLEQLLRFGKYARGGSVDGYASGGRKLLDLAKGIIGGEPQKTVSAYKLFRQKGDDLYPLFVNANKPVPMGEWLEAESGPLIGGKVKSSLGPLAYRPGWHAGDLPIATHIGGKSQPGLKAPDYRPDNQVWAEVLMPDDVDWQTEALARAQRSKAGNIIPRTAHITDQIPLGGHYRYKTNPNMTGEWLIGGSMKVNRVLPDDEVRAVNEGAGVSDLPRLIELMQRRGGYAGGGRALASLAKRILSTSRGSKPAAYFEIAPGATWDEGLQKSWETLGDTDKKRITDRAINDYFGRWKQASGIGGELSEGVGGFGGFTNPNKIFYPDNPKNLAPALNEIGELYAQDAMMGVGRAPFAGSSPRGLVSVRLPENVEHGRVHDIYQQLLDRGLTEGHSTDVGRGTMSMLAGSGGRDTDDIARAIDSTLGGRYPVSSVAAHVAFPENRIDYGLHRQSPLVRPEASVLGSYRSPQAGATDALKEEARSGVRSLVEEALGLTSGEKRVGREGGGRVGVAIELAKRLGRMLPEGSGYRSVPGKPAVVNMPGFGRVEARPIPEIENAAAAYNRAAGLGDHAVENFAPLHPGFSAKVAREFDRMPSNPSDPVVRRSYDALVDETLAQYRAAKDTGIDFRFLKPGQADPYAASPALGYEDIVNKGRLFVFPTDQGFGTLNKAAADSPLLRRVGRIGDKDDAVANDAFRIVHDLYGHYGPGNPFFRAPGEERAYQLHSKMFSRDALPAATAETRGQNSWVNYGPAGEINRSASGADTIYADQKIGVMPEWTSALPPAAGVDAEDYIRSLIGMRPRRAAGGSLIQDRHPTRYLPHVGRQVMADGGAASPSMNDLMATVNSVFSRSRPAATRESLTGVSSSPYISGPGAYTDAGGQQIAAPFITGMKDGYPVPPTPPAQPKEAAPSMVERILGKGRAGILRSMGIPGYEKGGSIIGKALKALSKYSDPPTKYINDWKWRPLPDVAKDVGTNVVPPHVVNFGDYMADMSDKAGTEGLDPEDAIKAYLITRSSIQREGRTPEKLAREGALIRETSDPLVRPEGQMAEFLRTPAGVRLLNDARKGDLSQDVVDAAQRVMKPFGMSSTEPDAMDWARRNLPSLTPWISDMVRRARTGDSPVSEWRDFTRDVRGVGPAKTGFIASLLGRGDLPTLDARQAILHTGMKNADVQGIMGQRAGRVGHEAVDRLAARQRAMNFQLPERLDPFYQHLAHHTVWDAIGNEKTTHQDIIDAMRPRAAGGAVGYASGGGKFAEMAADMVAKALEKAKAVHPSNRIYAYHNLNVDKIQPQIEKFGAIPAPSLAIAKPLGNPIDFGSATLIGRPHLAVPHEDNPVFRADAYTPRMPTIHEGKYWDRPHDFIFKEPGATGRDDEVPATAENIVNHMRARGILGGEGEVGMGLAKAVAHPPFKSLEEIQRSRYSLPDDAEENEELWSSLHGRASGLGGSLRPHSDYRTDWPAEQFLQGVVNYQRRGMEGLKEVYPRLPEGKEILFKGFIDDLKNTPAAYYEAKPLRPVGFDEFGGALLPTDDPRSSHVAELLSGAGVPKENILSYNPARHGERYRMLKERFGDFGFAEGGGVQDAMDIVRAARPDQREMEPSQREIDRYRDIVQQSHLTGGPASPEMRDVVVPLPFGKSIPLGRMPRATADMGELAGSALGLGARFAANLHPATRIGSYLLDAADVANTAGTLAKTGRMDASDFFSALPGNKANALGIIAALAGDEHEPARAVLNRMRDGRESGGAKIAKRVAKAAKEAEGKFIPLEEARARVASPFSDDPDSVEAARKIVESLKVSQGNKMDTGSFYNIKQTRPVSEVTSTIEDLPGVSPLTPRQMSWEDFVRQAKGGTLINVAGDRSNLGRMTAINGRDLAWPVDLHAGPKYMLEPNPEAVWANNPGHATGFWNAIREAAKSGPVFGAYHPMGTQSVDSSHNMMDALLAQIGRGDVYKKDMRRIDKILRSGAQAGKDEDAVAAAREAMKGWPGFENAEEAREFSRGLEGVRRAEIVKLLDQASRFREGFPAVGETRVAITDPALRATPGNMLGHRIVQFDPENLTPPSLAFTHSTYPMPTGGRYVGDVPLVQSQYVMPEVERNLMTKLAKGDRIVHPFSPDSLGRGSWRKSLETRKLGQPINDEMLDSIMLGMERQKDYGFRKGGSVVKLARDVISRKRDAA